MKTKKKKPPPDSQNLSEILKMEDRMEEMDYYQILKIPRKASLDETKQAYFDIAKKYHSDLLGSDLSPDEKSKISRIFDRINKAFRTLSNDVTKSQYDTQLNTGFAESQKNAIKMASTKFQLGRTLYNQGRYEEALPFLSDAVRLWKDNAQYYFYLALAETKIPSFRLQAEKDFLEAIRLEPWSPNFYVALGLLYKEEGMNHKALKQMEKALNIDPSYHKALQEKEEIKVFMRGKKKSVLSFRKKK
jgi:curved DNA-binding protein CbpA